MQEHFVQRVREIERASEQRRAALRTKDDAEAYLREVRGKIQQCFGPWPEKTNASRFFPTNAPSGSGYDPAR